MTQAQVITADLFKSSSERKSAFISTWSVKDFYIALQASRYFVISSKNSNDKTSCKIGFETKDNGTVFVGCSEKLGIDPIAVKNMIHDLQIGYAEKDGKKFYTVFAQSSTDTSGTF